jgi:exosortase
VIGLPSARTAAIAALAAAIVVLLGVLYAPTMKGLALEWASSPDSSYGAILAAIAAVVLWSRHRQFITAARRGSSSTWALATILVSLAAYLVGFLGADVFITRVSFVMLLAGIAWFLAGTRATRLLVAPLFFLLLAVPLPELVVNAITLPLQLMASRIAEAILGIMSIPVFRDGNILELRSTSLEVAEACSGLRSAISLTAMACLVAWATETALVRRAAIVAMAVPIAIVLNGARVAFTGVACEIWGAAAATGRWHTVSGWLTFVVAMFVLVGVQRVLPRNRRTADSIATEAAAA